MNCVVSDGAKFSDCDELLYGEMFLSMKGAVYKDYVVESMNVGFNRNMLIPDQCGLLVLFRLLQS